jgi:hypothetical protein
MATDGRFSGSRPEKDPKKSVGPVIKKLCQARENLDFLLQH